MHTHESIDHDRYDDDGNPNFVEREERSEVRQPELFTAIGTACSRFHRQHRVAVHMTTIAVIALSLVVDASLRPADWLFVALSVLCEVGQ